MQSYLSIVDDVLNSPEAYWKQNRTGVRTKALAGTMFKHDMSTGFPLLTTKFVPLRLVAVELEFFIKGLHDKRWLQERGCPIWNEWADPRIVPYGHDAETKRRMMEEPELGRVYGVQWRDFAGVDQVAKLIDTLKKDPSDRRMVVTAWNPAELNMMALPPCHYAWQVVVGGDNLDTLNLIWNQRSVDVALGLPFNIASYGLLLKLLAKEAGMKEGRLIGMLGDVHIYENHIENMKVQMERQSLPLPTVEINEFTNIFDWEYTQTKLLNYSHQGKLAFEIAV